jgi:predicted nucleic acid-binding protein
MSIVADASIVIDLALGDTVVDAAVGMHDLHAPVTIDAEILHAFRRHWLAKNVTDTEVLDLIAIVRRMSITRHAVQPLVNRMWAIRHNITAYDAGYVALAESLDLPLLTRDWRLAHSSGHAATIEYIA